MPWQQDRRLADLMVITNIWNNALLFRFRRLRGIKPCRPLFVGREKETADLLAELGSAPDSRQVVCGSPGVGKTTLVQHIKHEAARAGIYSYPDAVSLKSLDSADELLVRLLSYVHDTLYSSGGPKLRSGEAMRTAKQLVLAFRVKRGGVSASVLGVGGGFEVDTIFQQSPFVAPFMVVPRLLRELMADARRHEKRFNGLLVHMNNLENLAESERSVAGASVGDLRDVFLIDGYHHMIVATPEAVRDVITSYAQVRSVFMVHEPLAPRTFAALTRLLAQRYDYLKLDKGRPVRIPVEPAAVKQLYDIFAGDLRGLLRALNYAANQLLGYLGDQGAAPMTGLQLHAVLQPHYAAEISTSLSDSTRRYFHQLQAHTASTFTQAALADDWKVSQPRVSKALEELRRFGCVREADRDGRQLHYELTGSARLALQRDQKRAFERRK